MKAHPLLYGALALGLLVTVVLAFNHVSGAVRASPEHAGPYARDPKSSQNEALLAAASVLGAARILDDDDGGALRVAITITPSADLVMEDEPGPRASPFILGLLQNGEVRYPPEAGVYRVHLTHGIARTVAYFRGPAAERHWAWLASLLEWGTELTMREVDKMIDPDSGTAVLRAKTPEILTIRGVLTDYAAAIKPFPELTKKSFRDFLCTGNDVCDDAVLATFTVVIVE